MTHAYHLLPQKHLATQFHITYNLDHISLLLLKAQSPSFPSSPVLYEHVGGPSGLSTQITYGSEELLVEDNFVKVFCEDLEVLIENHKNQLLDFSLEYKPGEEESCGSDDISNIINRLYRCTENYLKSRYQKLKVEEIVLSVINVGQAVTIIQSLDPVVLKKVRLIFPFENWVVKPDDFMPLGGQNKGLELVLEFDRLNVTHCESIRMLLTYTLPFQWIFISYEEIVEKYLEALSGIEFEHVPEENLIIIEIENIEEIGLIERVSTRSDQLEETMLPLRVLQNELAMKIILDNLECTEIQKLRKVSYGIRHCIDRIQPDPHIQTYSFEFDKEGTIKICIGERDNGITYAFYHSKESEISSKNYLFRAVKDFELNLKYQKSCLEELNILLAHEFSNDKKFITEDSILESPSSDLIKFIKTTLSSRSQLLRVKKLKIFTFYQSFVMDILLFLDMDSLKMIELHSVEVHQYYSRLGNRSNCPPTLEVDQISKTEQWRGAKELVMSMLAITTPIQEMGIIHFSKVSIEVLNISSEDVFYLKSELIKSPNFKKFKIYYTNSTIAENLQTLIGEPYRRINNIKSVWYFRIPETKQFIHLVINYPTGRINKGSVSFTRIDQEATPFF